MILFYLLLVFHLVSLVFVSDENKNSGMLSFRFAIFMWNMIFLIARKSLYEKPAAGNTDNILINAGIISVTRIFG